MWEAVGTTPLIFVEVQGASGKQAIASDGSFSLTLNAGTYTLLFSAQNYKTAVVSDISIGPNEETDAINVTLESDPGAISGTVQLDVEGALEGTLVSVNVEGSDPATTLTDENGQFKIELPPNNYTLSISREQFRTESRAVQVVPYNDAELKGTDIGTITLLRTRGNIEGIVKRSANEQHDNVALRLLEAPYSTLSSSVGSFQFNNVPTDTYTLEACTRGYEPQEVPVSVTTEADQVIVTTTVEEIVLAKQQFSIPYEGLTVVTNAQEYNLNLESIPNWVTQVSVSGDVESAYTREFDASNSVLPILLSAGEGLKVVNLEFSGEGCRVSDVFTRTVNLDQSAPTLISFSALGLLNTAEGPVSADPTITVVIDSLEANRVILSGQGLSSVDAQVDPVDNSIPLSSSGHTELSIELNSLNDGAKIIQAVVIDEAGNQAEPVSLTVVLDRLAPQDLQFSVLSPAPITNPEAQVALSLNATGASEMMVSNEANFAGASWQTFNTVLPVWTLDQAEVDGEKRIYAKFRDLVGNESAALSTTTVVDRIGSINAQVILVGGTGSSESSTVFVDGAPNGSIDSNGTLTVADLPIGFHQVKVSQAGYVDSDLIDFTVGATETQPSDADLFLRSASGSIQGSVEINGPSALSEVSILIDGVSQGSPNQDGSFTFNAATFDEDNQENSFPRTHTVSVQLAEHSSDSTEVQYRVGATATIPENHHFVLNYQYGNLRIPLNFEGSNTCRVRFFT